MATGILSVDPGLTTGLCVLLDENFFSVELEGPMEFLDYAVDLLDANQDRAWEVVCESFIINPQTIKKSRQNYSLEIIGALRHICHVRAIPFTLQSPADGKSFGTDDKLKRIGWYHAGKGHANDSARHLLVYSVQHGRIDPATLVEAS